jgi:hypothetical protein
MTRATELPYSPVPSLAAKSAMRTAWMCWLALLAFPFLVFLYVVWHLMDSESVAGPAVRSAPTWFLAAMGYLIVAVPLSFFGRSRLFKAYWSGAPVTPGKYLVGMLTMWVTLEVGGIFALVGCLASHKLLPNLLPALIAFMFFTTLWPSGKAMTRTTGDQEDPQLYEEPR